MSVDSKMPEIRFKGFNRVWNYLTLGENAKFTKGQGYSKGDLVTNGSPIILYGRLYTKYQTVITSVDTFVTEKDKSVKSMGGEVIVPASGESPEDISRASVVSEPNVILGGDLNIVLPSKKIHSTFLALAISNGRLKKELSSKAQGKSVVHIRNSDLADLGLILPTEYVEQTAIGNYFQKLDSLINQHQQKHDKLSNIKKAMLEKMFPKQGETMPEIRFKGFNGEWVEKKLGEVFTYERPDNYIVKSAEYSDEYNTPVLTANKGFLLGYTNEKSTYNNPSIIFDDFTLDCKFIDFPYMVKSSAIKILTVKDSTKDDLLFAFHLLNNARIEVMGHARHYISVVQNTTVTIPKKNEQTTISNYFRKLDALINQHQQQITKLNNIKQACLSKMFV